MTRAVVVSVVAVIVLAAHVSCRKYPKPDKERENLPKNSEYGQSDIQGPDGRNLPNGPPIDDGRGFPVNNGKLTGRAKVKRAKLRYEEIVNAEERDIGDGEEPEKLYTQMEFIKWMEDYTRSETRPPINEAVQDFINASGTPLEVIEDKVWKKIKARKSGRKKRSSILQDSGVWDKCIVPYVLDGAVLADPSKAQMIRDGIAVLENLSGFRFKDYAATGTTPGNNSQWSLSHNNYLRFLDLSSCWSYVGNLASYFANGQNISTCFYMSTILHEIGHALGFLHENVNPVSMAWVRTDFQNIDNAMVSNYYRTGKWNIANFNKDFYDMSSIMHYEDWMFNINYGKTMTMLDSDDEYLFDKAQKNIFYLLPAAQSYHGCFSQFPSCNPLPTCSGGGLVSVVDGQCRCICPEGLEPSTGCTTKYAGAQLQWPTGTYSFLKSSTGSCPAGFSTGSFKQFPPNYHWQGGSLLDPSTFDWYSLTQTFCTKTDPAQGSGKWPPGSYCILRKGACPSGFLPGKIAYNGKGTAVNINGVLPDGAHDTLIEYYFCCRADERPNAPLILPSANPFVLFKKGSTCPDVADMDVTEEYYNFQFDLNYPFVREGSYPTIYSYEFYSDPFYRQHVNVYYCVYIPLNTDSCGVIKTFTNTETNYTFTTPNYPNSYPQNKQCMWHFTSPEGTTMQLQFDTFQVSAVNDANCNSYVEVKNWHPGFLKGFRFCGQGYQKTIWSKHNTMSVKFVSDLGQSWTGFSARITVIKDDNKCYTGDGSHGVYAGSVNYTKEFKQCLAWDTVKNCTFYQSDSRTFDDDIAGTNYCRNTGVGRRPWCYIDKETCEIQECDACAIGQCFDIASDCAQLKTNDPTFCTRNDLGEARRLCMQSCGFCSAHVPKPPASQNSCTMPEDVQGIGPNIQPGRTSFPVGQVVEYVCPTTGHIRTRVCTSEGTWSKLFAVCGVCPNGWSVYDKRCYKWLGYTENHNYLEAKTMCEALNARLPKIDSAGRNQFLFELVDIEKFESDTFWVGLKKRDSVWRWQDESTPGWSNWNTAQPDGSGDCTSFRGSDGKWEDNVCSSNLHYVVCEIELPDADRACTCDDSRDDCATLLARDPTLCTQSVDYAWHNCRRTCAVGACNTAATCDDSGTNLGLTGQRIRGTSTVNVGNYTEYKCNTGYYLTAGDLKRACLPGGTLTGSVPVCSTPSQTPGVELFPNANIRRRDSYSSSDSRYILTANNANMLITIPGNITTWKYYSNHPGEVAFVVLRLKSGKYEVVGKNVVSNTADDRKSVLRVPVAEQITVQVNDLVGLYIKTDEISFTMCSSTYMPQNTGWLRSSTTFASASSIAVATQYTFYSMSYCRYYSVQATVQPSA